MERAHIFMLSMSSLCLTYHHILILFTGLYLQFSQSYFFFVIAVHFNY